MQDKELGTELEKAFATVKRSLRHIGFFSFFINILMLTAPLYMLQVYDRVLISRNEYTLLYLTIVAVAALGVMGALELIRSRILVRVSARFDKDLANTVFSTVVTGGKNSQSFRDLETIRTFFTGSSLLSLFDAPWTPLFIFIVYVLHPVLGHIALVGAILLFVLALINEAATRDPLAESASESSAANNFAETSARNVEAVQAMGMVPGLKNVWREWHGAGLGFQAFASDRASFIAAAAKFIRFGLQVSILGGGAYLAIQQIITPGAMIAASIIMARALSPVESAIGGWRSFLGARSAYSKLNEALSEYCGEAEQMPLPPPKGQLTVDNVYGLPPNSDKAVVSGASFSLNVGTTLGITGPSAAGKSSLARLIVGVWKPRAGIVRLDGVDISQWRREEVGPYIGYLPQDIELFNGSVALNIARYSKPDPQLVVEAAKLAGAHEMILELVDGYDTVIGDCGHNLSGGQRQRIGLARAFYGMPPFIVLDEPTSNLDAEGEAAVRNAIQELKAANKTVIVIAHRPALIGGVDQLMVMQKGVIEMHGPTVEIMPRITKRVVAGLESQDTQKVLKAPK